MTGYYDYQWGLTEKNTIIGPTPGKLANSGPSTGNPPSPLGPKASPKVLSAQPKAKVKDMEQSSSTNLMN